MITLNITVDIPPTTLFNMEELKQKVTTYANSLIARQHTTPSQNERPQNAYISERIKALETGFECREYASDDYKTELQELKAQRYA